MTTSPLTAETTLANLRTWRKAADIGGDPSQGFEQSFANLAFSYVQDKAPRLLDYMVGFQLVDRNDDNTKAMGLFGFEIGGQWVYAPVFFINGDLKGHELLYMKQSDTFVPMKENWINYLLSRKSHILGDASPEDAGQMGIRQPDLAAFSTPPGSGMKRSSFTPRLRPWAKAAMPLIAALATDNIKTLPKYAGLDERLSLQNVLREDIALVKAAMKHIDQYPTMAAHLKRFYGPDLLKTALLDLKKRAVAAKPSIFDPVPEPVHQEKIASILIAEPVKQYNSVEIITGGLNKAASADLSDEQRTQLINAGFVIKDAREDEEVSTAYKTQTEMKLVNPDETGVYDVLVKENKFERCLVIVNPHGKAGQRNMLTVVRLSDSKAWVNADRTNVWARSVESRDEYQEWFDDQASPESLSDKGLYIALSPTRQGSVPFKVTEDLGDSAYRVDFNDYVSYDYRRPGYLPELISSDQSGGDCSQPEIVQLNDERISKFRSLSNTLYIPKDAKIFTIKKPPEPKDDDPYCCSYQSDPAPIRLGNLVDLQVMIMQKTAGIKLVADHSEVVINDRRFPKLAGLFHLVRDHGFREDVARTMLKAAEKFGGARFRVKYADPYSTGQGPGAPAFPEPQMGNDQGFGGVPTMGPQEEFQPVPELSAANTDPQAQDPTEPPDQNSMQVAQEAGQTGQKEVFDTAMISSMLKAVREESLVDRYLGDLMKALDRLGRILFMFYWHNEEFSDRYGQQDMPELEDTLRNAFEVLGDLLLFLKAKTIDANPQQLGQPQIDQSARN